MEPHDIIRPDGKEFTFSYNGVELTSEQSFGELAGMKDDETILVSAAAHRKGIASAATAAVEASVPAEQNLVDIRKAMVEDGSLAMLIDYLEDECAQPLFDIKQGNGKKLRDQNIPAGWRLADESDVEKDKDQILAMYKPQEVVWTRKETKRKAGMKLRYITKEKTTSHMQMNYGPAQMAHQKAFKDDGSIEDNANGDEAVQWMLIVRDIRDPRTGNPNPTSNVVIDTPAPFAVWKRADLVHKYKEDWPEDMSDPTNFDGVATDAIQRVLQNMVVDLGAALAEERQEEIEAGPGEVETVYRGTSKHQLEAEKEIAKLQIPDYLANSKSSAKMKWRNKMAAKIRADAAERDAADGN